MSVSAGIDAILLFHVWNPKQATEKTSKKSLKKEEILRAMNNDYKKYNTDLNTIDTSIWIWSSIEIWWFWTQKHELLKNCIKMGSMSLVEEN